MGAFVFAGPALSRLGGRSSPSLFCLARPIIKKGRGFFVGLGCGGPPRFVARACGWGGGGQFGGAGGGIFNVFFQGGFQNRGPNPLFSSVADSGNQMHRRFCPSCGTPLFSEAEARPHLIFVRVGTFHDPNLANPAMTIWTSSAPRWACISAELSQVLKQPPPAA